MGSLDGALPGYMKASGTTTLPGPVYGGICAVSMHVNHWVVGAGSSGDLIEDLADNTILGGITMPAAGRVIAVSWDVENTAGTNADLYLARRDTYGASGNALTSPSEIALDSNAHGWASGDSGDASTRLVSLEANREFDAGDTLMAQLNGNADSDIQNLNIVFWVIFYDPINASSASN